MVVFLVYMSMYLIRNNFKATQPFLKEQYGISTLELGYIGLAFSIIYGVGKTALGYFIVFNIACVIVVLLLAMVGIIEERKIKAIQAAKAQGLKVAKV